MENIGKLRVGNPNLRAATSPRVLLMSQGTPGVCGGRGVVY